jgi:(2Fe-2S) ferredoxin
MRPRCHVFVCTNLRPAGGRPACAGRGGAELVASLTRAVLARGLGAEIAVTPSGCLGPCFEGPNLIVYPDAVWYQGVTLDDVDDLVAHLAGGPEVTRLLRSDDD